MFSRIATPAVRAAFRPSSNTVAARAFQTSARRAQDAAAVAMPVRRPVGAFRGALFGFFAGSTAAAAATYYYVLEEYRLSNEMLTEDIYAMQAAVQRIHDYVQTLEEKVETMEKKK